MSAAIATAPRVRIRMAPLPAQRGHKAARVVQRGRRRKLIYRNEAGEFRTKRARTDEEKEAASVFGLLRALNADPAFWSVAMTLPGNQCRSGRRGRPTHNPSWAFLMIAELTTLTGSQRSAITFISDPVMWDYLRAYTNAYCPREFDGLGLNPPQRHHLSTFLRKWEDQAWEVVRGSAHEQFRSDACTRARTRGLFNADQPLRYNTIDPGQHIVFDGTVFAGPATKQTTRADGEGFQLKSGTERVWGSKVVFASTRSDDYQSRLVLDYEQVTGQTATGVGDEAAATITSTLRLKEELPGLRGVIVDSILRGKHLTHLAGHGVIVTNYPHAERNPDSKEGGRFAEGRIDKRTQLRTLTHKRPNKRTCTHTLVTVGAVIYQPVLNDEGNEVLQECPVTGYTQRRNPSGEHRYYLRVQVPCKHGDLTTDLPLYHEDNSPGAVHGINRGEHLRFYPPNTANFHALYSRRNDSESYHRQIKQHLTRLPAYRVNRQSLFLLGMALVNNAATRAFEQQRNGEPNPLDGTG
ncbi:MAG: hypothetical protein K9G80_03450 [Candidatus Nanopelagicales bacterium]|nr:hypothetical protein [Candidatus Nanopelagicales bacterium]